MGISKLMCSPSHFSEVWAGALKENARTAQSPARRGSVSRSMRSSARAFFLSFWFPSGCFLLLAGCPGRVREHHSCCLCFSLGHSLCTATGPLLPLLPICDSPYPSRGEVLVLNASPPAVYYYAVSWPGAG